MPDDRDDRIREWTDYYADKDIDAKDAAAAAATKWEVEKGFIRSGALRGRSATASTRTPRPSPTKPERRSRIEDLREEIMNLIMASNLQEHYCKEWCRVIEAAGFDESTYEAILELNNQVSDYWTDEYPFQFEDRSVRASILRSDLISIDCGLGELRRNLVSYLYDD